VRPEQRHQIALGHIGGQVAYPERVRIRNPSSGAAPAGESVLRRGGGGGGARLRRPRGRRFRRHRRRGGDGMEIEVAGTLGVGEDGEFRVQFPRER
jgi:hypothetical protein